MLPIANNVQAHKNDARFKMTGTARMAKKTRAAYAGGSSTPDAKKYLETYDIERRSVFVGGISVQTEDDLCELFEQFGPIYKITKMSKPSGYNSMFSSCLP